MSTGNYSWGSSYTPPSGMVNSPYTSSLTNAPTTTPSPITTGNINPSPITVPKNTVVPNTNFTNQKNTNMSGGEIAKMVGVAAPIIAGVYGMHVANKAAKDAESQMRQNQEILATLESSRQQITNPYANLGVATQAAEMQAEQADIALANTLDTLRATGAGAGGATALAQAALQSKQGVSASIEQQELQNEKLKAQGEQFVFQARETREMQKLDRTAGLIDRDMAQAAQYRSDALGALTGGLTGAASMAASLYGGTNN